MNSITQKQFERAESICGQIRNTIDLRGKLLKRGEIDSALALPGTIWSDTVEPFAYCLKPSFDVVNTWRLHSFMFSGYYLGYSILDQRHIPVPKNVTRQYLNLTRGLPDKMIARPPEICGEMGWKINGGIVNKDVLMYQYHLTALFRSGVFSYLKNRSKLNILEVGGGYGGLAYFLKEVFPMARYYMVDLPESLLFPSVYFSVCRGEEVKDNSVYDGSDKKALSEVGSCFTFIPNFLVEDIPKEIKFDLIINTGSLGEMSEAQAKSYINFFSEHLKDDGVIFEGNHEMWIPLYKYFKKEFKRKKIQGSFFEKIKFKLLGYVGSNVKNIWFKGDEVWDEIIKCKS